MFAKNICYCFCDVLQLGLIWAPSIKTKIEKIVKENGIKWLEKEEESWGSCGVA